MRLPARIHQHVGRLEIAVNDPQRVRLLNRLSRLDEHRQHVARELRAVLPAMGRVGIQRFPVDVGHHQVK